MSYSHSRKPDLPETHSSPLCTWLSVLCFFAPAKTTLLGQGYVFFVGGGNIAIVTALPLLNFVLHCVQIFISLWFIYILFFMLAWNFGFRTWRLTGALGVLFLGPAEYSAVMCGAFPRT